MSSAGCYGRLPLKWYSFKLSLTGSARVRGGCGDKTAKKGSASAMRLELSPGTAAALVHRFRHAAHLLPWDDILHTEETFRAYTRGMHALQDRSPEAPQPTPRSQPAHELAGMVRTPSTDP